ncbi:hypothetical protein E4U41_001076 [Claviceps citrina]|nr:hypothetical protein E4U41_001076 [Claviceps citrina]
MASHKSKPAAAAAADDTLDELFQGIGDDARPKKPANPKSAKPAHPSSSKATGDNDILADLESQLASETASTSRPHTPRLKDAAGLPRPSATPPLGGQDRTTAAAVRKSTDSATSLRASFTPSATSSELHEADKKGSVDQLPPQPQPHPQQQQQAGAGAGWWGGILSTATGVMKHAEAAYKEIQHNEEAKKWADQVRGLSGGIHVGALRNYGDEIRSRALPTFTNILHTLAPPISSHERLMVHITHDLVGYPSLDRLVDGVFARVMSQVEGGDLLVIQRGQESSSRRHGDAANAGWRDGPWWRQTDSPRELGLVKGMVEGTKLCRAGAESYASEYFAATGGIDQARTRATQDLSESNPVRTSDLFLSVQAIAVDADQTLFAGSTSSEKEKESLAVKEQHEPDELVCFAVHVLDPVHEIQFSTHPDPVPVPVDAAIHDDVRDILDSGGVDPREWVADWLEHTLDLSVGVVAQRYVARRMGVGEAGLDRGKKPVEESLEAYAGEAARAGII